MIPAEATRLVSVSISRPRGHANFSVVLGPRAQGTRAFKLELIGVSQPEHPLSVLLDGTAIAQIGFKLHHDGVRLVLTRDSFEPHEALNSPQHNKLLGQLEHCCVLHLQRAGVTHVGDAPVIDWLAKNARRVGLPPALQDFD